MQPAIETRKIPPVRTVRILTWIAVELFFLVFLLAPTGITVSWGFYLVLFSPIIVIDISALIAFGYCKARRHPISLAYPALCIAVLLGVAYLTLFELRLRWHML